MLHQPTIEKLLAMHLEPMVETWRNFEQNEDAASSASKKNSPSWSTGCGLAPEPGARTATALRQAKGNACVEDIDYRAAASIAR